ncbi:MAG: hypothetical protein ABSB41_19520 [Anaerolineales bacterium]|jgi:hypothetical protein
MKKILFSLTLVSLALVLALVACAGKAATSSPTPVSSSGGGGFFSGTPVPGGGGGGTTQPLPLIGQLLVGTFKLEGTSNAVDAKEAASLIPLWQAYAQLTSSNTAAQAEIDAVVSQIQSTMTPQQTQAITAMKLTRQDEFTTMSSLGLTNFGANGTPGFRGTPRSGGTGGGGGFGGGGGGFGGGGGGGFAGGGGGFGGGAGGAGGTAATRSPGAIATLQAARAQAANRISTPLMNALISLLQKRAGTSS